MTRGKPSTLQFIDHMSKCATSLANENQYPTDSAIPSLIQLQHLTEEYHTKFGRARAAMHTPTSTAQVKTDLDAVQAQMQAARMSMSPILRQASERREKFGLYCC